MAKGSHYSDKDRRAAVAQYVLHGNWRRVSAATGIPERTLNDWSAQPWFGTLLAEVRAEKGAELEGAYTQVIEEATAQLIDRVRNGDYVLTKAGLERKPVNARDLALLSAIVFDKRQLHRHQPTAIQGGATLQDIAQMLTEVGKAHSESVDEGEAIVEPSVP